MKLIVKALAEINWGKRAHAILVLCAMTVIALPAQILTTVFGFESADGAHPYAGLVQATDGNLYGTTLGGGASSVGTVFKITAKGVLTTLYSFCSQSGCTDGESPYAGLIQATNGDFYGTTEYGGANDLPVGTIFKITSSGTLTTLHSFCSQGSFPYCTDGAEPQAGLVQAINGDLYGTTFRGGANGLGTIFKITPGGALTTLYAFCSQSGCTDGSNPVGGLIQAIDGNFYGATFGGGGEPTDSLGDGTIFKITPGGALTTLYSFCSLSGCTDGKYPEAGLIQGTDGDFYGTTSVGGVNGDGTVFRITPSGTLTTLYSFCSQSGCTDGQTPRTGLVQATDGDFYGTTNSGGANPGPYGAGYGTIFKITPSGTLTTLYSFCSQSGCTDGLGSTAPLIQATNGDFYGPTYFGGDVNTCKLLDTYESGCGTLFRLSVGLGPFVKTLPTAGEVGEVVKILGTNLTGATSVSFNGTPAVFKVISSSLIATTVPAGTTSGSVHVVIPSGTLSSNVFFQVLP
jgi:uncharacterized repeat protein (TIGR03803 family)